MAPKRKASAMASTSKVSAKEVQSKRASKKQATEANDKNESDVAIPKAEPTTTKQDGVEQVDGKGASTFTLFPKLVLEIRIKIWGMAAPDPCIVIQCKSNNPNRLFRYFRDGGKVPAVLHACRESRAEFLDKNDGSVDITLERRRRAHPVYKLCFIDHGGRPRRSPAHTTSPVFFSTDIDILWAQRDVFRHYYVYNPVPALKKLDIAPELKHFVWTDNIMAEDTVKIFPKLESITTLLPDKRTAQAGPSGRWFWRKVVPGPEVNGVLGDATLCPEDLAFVDGFREFAREWLKRFKWRHPGKTPPAYKHRFEKQFMEAEGLKLPTPPEDPFAEFDSD